MKRAYWSFCLLTVLYGLSLAAELLCNSVPLWVRFRGESYFPVLRFYPEDVFTGSGKMTRPDYKALRQLPAFTEEPGNWMLFPPVPYGQYEVIASSQIEASEDTTLVLTPVSNVGAVYVTSDLRIVRSTAAGFFSGQPDRELKGRSVERFWPLADGVKAGIASRFANREASAISAAGNGANGVALLISMSAFTPRRQAPRTVRLTLREQVDVESSTRTLVLGPDSTVLQDRGDLWGGASAEARSTLLKLANRRLAVGSDITEDVVVDGTALKARAIREIVRFPFRPVRGHWLGIDHAGRDVLVRVIYGLRTSMTFGLLLVACSMCVGTCVGALQGYFGGKIDITAQRFIEVWSALPFLYIMILMGSVYGRSFALLVFCYGLFNWIGMSYYTRAEFLRLRKMPFVEAARCLGLPTRKIVFRHILPNALVPLITLFPFSLVGAIGSLAALDYLGFGLPPPTASWGELLQQAQQFRWAWWLIFYPSLSLFVVMLMGVFIGEGVRNAFDPKRFSRMQ